MSTGKQSKTAKRTVLRLGWMSAISFLLATVLMWVRHEWAAFGSLGFAFIGVFLTICGLRLKYSVSKKKTAAYTRQDLRPNDWRLIWPELAEQKEAA